jgi:cell division protein FtsN/nucleoid DNA-binding protein
MEQQNSVNRADILRKCVEQGVGSEEEIGSVSRLFYVQMLSALQRGQTVEVPGFGIFGTRVAGVKKIKKIPYFEPSLELADRANERFRELKCLLVGTYHQIPASAEAEFHGKVPPYDPVIDTLGKDRVIDTRGDVSPREYEQLMASTQRPQKTEEDSVMPRLNLKDESAEDDSLQEPGQEGTPPTLREVGGGGGGLSPVILIVLILAVLGLGVFALNHFGVIHLWGKKAVKVAEAFPEPALPEPMATPAEGSGQPPAEGTQAQTSEPPAGTTSQQAAPEQTPAITPPSQTHTATAPAPAVAPSAAPTGPGRFTIQVSSWASKSKADAEAARLSSAGYGSYVEEGLVGGTTWYRVRVGRYATEMEAKEAIAKMQPGVETDLWVARFGK